MPTSGSISVDSEGLDPEVEAPACSAPATGHDLDPKRRGINSRRPNVQSVGMVDGGLCLPSRLGRDRASGRLPSGAVSGSKRWDGNPGSLSPSVHHAGRNSSGQ
jgi:hypothetical protein